MADLNMVKKIQALVEAIDDQDTLRMVNVAVVDRLRSLRQEKDLEARGNFKAGDIVKFTRQKNGLVVTGKLTKVNYSRAVVKVDRAFGQSESWTVPLSMLRAA